MSNQGATEKPKGASYISFEDINGDFHLELFMQMGTENRGDDERAPSFLINGRYVTQEEFLRIMKYFVGTNYIPPDIARVQK